MHRSKVSPEATVSGHPAAPTAVSASRWELDAALAVLARAHAEFEAMANIEATQQERVAVQRRLQSAQRLVARINGKMSDEYDVPLTRRESATPAEENAG